MNDNENKTGDFFDIRCISMTSFMHVSNSSQSMKFVEHYSEF